MSRIKVPEGMLEAARRARIANAAEPGPADVEPGVFLTEKIVEAALGWLAEKPIPLTPEMYAQLKEGYLAGVEKWSIYEFIWEECQRRVFLVPDEAETTR